MKFLYFDATSTIKITTQIKANRATMRHIQTLKIAARLSRYFLLVIIFTYWHLEGGSALLQHDLLLL